jgi:hypothetical protein
MSQTKVAQEMMKVLPDLSQILGILRQSDVAGPMRDYAEARNAGTPIHPQLAQNAQAEAMKHLMEAKNKGLNDTTVGVSVGILEALLKDIASYAKMAASRAEITKLAAKFEKAIKR